MTDAELVRIMIETINEVTNEFRDVKMKEKLEIFRRLELEVLSMEMII